MSFYNYFKLVAENNLISKNKWFFMWLIVFLSGAGGAYQTFEVEAQKALGIKAVHEVSKGFQAVLYNLEKRKPEKKVLSQTIRLQPIITNEIVKEITKEILIDCSRCTKQLNEIIDKKIGARHD